MRRNKQLRLDFDSCFGGFLRGAIVEPSDIDKERTSIIEQRPPQPKKDVDVTSQGSLGASVNTKDSPNLTGESGPDALASSGIGQRRNSMSSDISPTSFSKDPRVAADAAAGLAAALAAVEADEKDKANQQQDSSVPSAAQLVSQTLGAACFSMPNGGLENWKGDLGAALADAGFSGMPTGNTLGGENSSSALGGGSSGLNSAMFGGMDLNAPISQSGNFTRGGAGGRRGRKVTVHCRRDVGGAAMEVFFALLQLPEPRFDTVAVNMGATAEDAISQMLAVMRKGREEALEESGVVLFDPARFELAIAEPDGRQDEEFGVQRFRGTEVLNESWLQHVVLIPRTDSVTAPFVPRRCTNQFETTGALAFLRFTVQMPNIGGAASGAGIRKWGSGMNLNNTSFQSSGGGSSGSGGENRGGSFGAGAAGTSPHISVSNASGAGMPPSPSGLQTASSFGGGSSAAAASDSPYVYRSIDLPCDLPMNFVPEFLCSRLFYRHKSAALVEALETSIAFDLSNGTQGASSQVLASFRASNGSAYLTSFRLDNGGVEHGDTVSYMTLLMLWRWGVRRLVLNMTKDTLLKLLRQADGLDATADAASLSHSPTNTVVEMDDAQACAFRTYLVTKINNLGARQERQFDVHGAYIYNHLPGTEFGTKNPRREIADISSLRICTDTPVRCIIEYGGSHVDPNVGMTLAAPHTQMSPTKSGGSDFFGGGDKEAKNEILEFTAPDECKAFVAQVSVLRNIQRLNRIRSMSFVSSASSGGRASFISGDRAIGTMVAPGDGKKSTEKAGFFSKLFS